jgi:hypothetical protein
VGGACVAACWNRDGHALAARTGDFEDEDGEFVEDDE